MYSMCLMINKIVSNAYQVGSLYDGSWIHITILEMDGTVLPQNTQGA